MPYLLPLPIGMAWPCILSLPAATEEHESNKMSKLSPLSPPSSLVGIGKQYAGAFTALGLSTCPGVCWAVTLVPGLTETLVDLLCPWSPKIPPSPPHQSGKKLLGDLCGTQPQRSSTNSQLTHGQRQEQVSLHTNGCALKNRGAL